MYQFHRKVHMKPWTLSAPAVNEIWSMIKHYRRLRTGFEKVNNVCLCWEKMHDWSMISLALAIRTFAHTIKTQVQREDRNICALQSNLAETKLWRISLFSDHSFSYWYCWTPLRQLKGVFGETDPFLLLYSCNCCYTSSVWWWWAQRILGISGYLPL